MDLKRGKHTLKRFKILVVMAMSLLLTGCQSIQDIDINSVTNQINNSIEQFIDENQDVIKQTAQDTAENIIDGIADKVTDKVSEKIDETFETKEDTAETVEETDEVISTDIDDNSSFQVHFIDVGQADATLITCDGESMLIDAGTNDSGTAIQNYLEKQNISTLKYVIGTHPDTDHYGGLDVIITKFDCGTVILSPYEKDSVTARDVYSAMKFKNYTITNPTIGTVYSLGAATFEILGPAGNYSDANDASVCIKLTYGNNSFLFAGDATETAENDILTLGKDLSADVYKVSHHGSHSSSSEAFVNAINPTYAVISCGENNDYGHPHAEVLNRLREKNINVFRTDEQGTIIVTSDGNNLTWNCTPSTTWKAGN